jgi:hypothetical protein
MGGREGRRADLGHGRSGRGSRKKTRQQELSLQLGDDALVTGAAGILVQEQM